MIRYGSAPNFNDDANMGADPHDAARWSGLQPLTSEELISRQCEELINSRRVNSLLKKVE